MKILFLTEGGKKIGFGHITRCIALCEAFEEKGINPELLANGDSSILNLLKLKKFQRFDWVEDEERLFQDIDDSDFIIIDSYLAKKSLYDKISKMTDGRMLMVDDYNRINYPKGIVVNPSICEDKLNYSEKSDTIYLLGKDYIILRKEFWNVPEKKINKEVRNILITFGGMNLYVLAKKIVNFLKEKFDFNFYIVDTRNNKLSAKEMLNLMLKSDVCISGGGQTTYELARIGAPTIGVCLAENQLGNLMGLEKVEFLRIAGWFNDNDLFQKIKENIDGLDYKSRFKMSKTGKKYVDGKGVERILKKIFERIGK